MGKEYEEIKAEISVRISTEDIDDIVTTALEGGICYWCRRAEVKGKYLGEFASEQISRGGVLVLHDSVDDKKRELNKEKLLSGVKQYLENEDKPYNILVDASIDLETVMKKLDEIVENKAREYVKVQEDKAEEERGFRYFEIWDENGQSAKFYIVEQYLELSQSMMEAIAESLAKGAEK